MKNVPNLRFKEFSEELEYKKLGEIVDYKKGYAFKSNNYCDSGTRIIKISDTSSNSIKDDDITCISDEKAADYKEWQLQEDDIIVSTVGSRPPLYSSMVGKIILVPKRYQDSLLNQNLVRLRTNELSTQRYLYFCLNRKRYIKHIEGICRGNANQVSITLEDLFDYQLRLPSLVEQEKISEFFSLIDKKIELQTEKVEELKNYKKGLLQKIFSQELRFKDENGNEYPEWERKRLQDIVEKKIKGKNPIYSRTGNILLNNDFMENNTEPLFVGNEIDVNINDILILWDGSQAGKVYTGFEGVLGSTFVAITLNKDNCNIFIREQLEYNLNKIQRVWREGSGVPHVAKDFIENYKIFVPSYEEQSKISKMLLNSNEKIQLEERKLQYIKELKKGLLQQMFI